MKHSEINTVKHLANYLRCDESFIKAAIDKEYKIIDTKDMHVRDYLLMDHNSELTLYKLYLKKKGKSLGNRIVYEVATQQLANTLKILNEYLSLLLSPRPCVHGFVKTKSIKTNANCHLAKKIILSVDIANYFESINVEMIIDNLIEIGFTKEVSKWIAKIITVNGHLVQGFHTSPTMANIVTDKMDNDILQVCDSSMVYTRYADDLYFSSMDKIPNVSAITDILSKYGFRLNENKTKVMKRGGKQYVTGLTVFDEKMPRIPNRIKRNLRLEVYYISKFGLRQHAIRRLKARGVPIDEIELGPAIGDEMIEIQHRLFGWLHFVRSIEPRVGNILYNKLIERRYDYISRYFEW